MWYLHGGFLLYLLIGFSHLTWQQILPDKEAAIARKIAVEIANRLRDPDIVISATKSIADAISLSRGLAGTALLFSQLDKVFPHGEWGRIAHEHIAAAVHLVFDEEAEIDIGLFGGLSGLASSVALLASGGQYRLLLGSIDEVLGPAISGTIDGLKDFDSGTETPHFDLVSGVVGLGTYLTTRIQQLGSDRNSASQLNAIRRYLNVILKKSLITPRWYTSRNGSQDPSHLARSPEGHLNCGMAHGMPGALSLAARWSVGRKNWGTILVDLAVWLLDLRRQVGFWPDIVPLQKIDGQLRPVLDNLHPTKAVWCYGSGGICRSLILTARAIGDAGLEQTARDCLLSDLDHTFATQPPEEVTICHGKAGVLQILARTNNELAHVAITERIRHLAAIISEEFDTSKQFGYSDELTEENSSDRPGLLTGAAGIALVLLSVSSKVSPAWDRSLLIS